jgi:peptidoglycan/xylan/chitin deacetylase (PgdA/CDA1 family)
MAAKLTVVMYHYVRDFPHTRFPRIKGILTTDFCRQVELLAEHYEMATLESSLAFLSGSYRPIRDLCLLTFDDGFKEHYTDVLPILTEKRIQGVFFLPTLCIEQDRMLPVHKNHFLMAALDFANYRDSFFVQMARIAPDFETTIDSAKAALTYRWDTPEVASFKFMLNFCLPGALRERILNALFIKNFGEEAAFARELYLNWDEAQSMQSAGMALGGHSHNHIALATLSDDSQSGDLSECTAILRRRLRPQPIWAFSYPYGKKHSYNAQTVRLLHDLGYSCGFVTEVGHNHAGEDLFGIKRLDTKDVAGPAA